MNEMIFAPRPAEAGLPGSGTDLQDALECIFLTVVKLELDTGKAWLLYSKGKRGRRPYAFDWNDFVEFCRVMADSQGAEELSDFLDLQKLRGMWDARDDDSTAPSSLKADMRGLEILMRFGADRKSPAVYFFTQYGKENSLLQRIIELYVYNNCDYFICLDAKTNSYIMFSSKDNTPLPAARCSDYSAELVKYAENFVVPEDREMVIREMGLDRVEAELDMHGVHAFSCGVWEEQGYARKRLEYRYYDREQRKILLSRSDVTELYNEQQRHLREMEDVLRQAKTDPLTGLLNSRGIQEAVVHNTRNTRNKAALFFLDLDNFKKVNDAYGHGEGDRALVSIAEALKHSIRAGDHAARIGGDEFVIFFDDLSSAQAADCARRLCARVAQCSQRATLAQLSCSIGVALFPEEGMDYETLVKVADAKAYRAKFSGKNRFVI